MLLLLHMHKSTFANVNCSEMHSAVGTILQDSAFMSKVDLIFAQVFQAQHDVIAQTIDSVPMYLAPISSTLCGGITSSFLESIEWIRLETASDFGVLLARLKAFPGQIAEYICCLQQGVRTGYVASTAMMTGVVKCVEKLATDVGPFQEMEAVFASALFPTGEYISLLATLLVPFASK